MTQKPDYDRGFKDGIRTAVTFLHNKSSEMNDPSARCVLDMVAFHLGNEFSEKVQRLKRVHNHCDQL